MKHGICLLTLIPQRAEPSEKSEMVNQLLFGDLFNIIEKKGSWIKISAEYDGYIGWVDEKMTVKIDEKVFSDLRDSHAQPIHTFTKARNIKNNHTLYLSPGSSLYNISDNSFYVNGHKFELQRETLQIEDSDIENLTKQFLNVPYLWGGKSIFGIDCSGLTQVIYKILGQKLTRDASGQSKQGETISFIQEAKQGDLAFFDNEEGNITHVGILLDSQTIIHASGYVRIDKIDAHGIFNGETNGYTHRLRVVKRLKGL